jgi:ATP-binding cassette subfamily F protein 3
VLTLSGLHKAFGGQVVLAGVNWFVPAGARVALVGANGSGKTTLLKIIAGQAEADGGTLSLPRGTTVGYLPQEVMGQRGGTVLARAMTAFDHVHEIATRCRELEHALAECPEASPQHDSLMAEYTAAREAWDTHGSYDLESRAEAVLAGLGFGTDDLQRDCGEFSGGWQMRLALAILLLRQPHLLLLDEPTNHLDLEARDWLERFLQSYPHTVILVAHDRYFLDQMVTRISELSRGCLTDFECNYSRYLVEKEQRQLQQEEAYRLQQEEIARVEAFISRFRYQASKAALVQSRIKQLEKMERVAPPEGGLRSVHFRFPQPARSGRTVLELTGVRKAYGTLTVYGGLDLAIERGHKIALVGPNGAGKSTLMRLLAGVDPIDAGQRRVGHNVTLSYFAQDSGTSLDPDKTVLDTVTEVAPIELVPQVRNLLGSFLFSGDSVYKRARVLSGGERSRLALATLLLRPMNCLLLDEPTNHLDLAAKEVLLKALLDFTGTLVFVAHDRYFLDRLPDEVVEVGHGTAVRYLGNYEEYLRKKASDPGGPQVPIRASGPVLEEATGNRPARPIEEDRVRRKRAAREVQRRERELAEVEQLIAAREEEIGEVGAIINDPEFYQRHENPHVVFSRFAKLKDEVESLYARLERLERRASEATSAQS